MARAQTCDVSSVDYNSIKHARDVSGVLYGAIMTRTSHSQRAQLLGDFIKFYKKKCSVLFFGAGKLRDKVINSSINFSISESYELPTQKDQSASQSAFK